MRIYYSLYDRLLSASALVAAFKKVKSAKGAAGIDGQSIYGFADQEEKYVAQLLTELKAKTYKPQPVRRVVIPKDGGGERKLGIPCVRDRVVQQALLDILQPIFEPDFHPSSYAYRPGRGCHQAIAKVTMFARKYELRWALDLDLSKCFDTLDHELILQAFKKRVVDGSILNLLRLFLKSGVMEDGVVKESDVGSPQGGVISPLVANVYLNAFDQEMKVRGHRIVRYADDIVILKRSKSAVLNVQEQARRYLEENLRLTVNTEKTKLVRLSDGISYLGLVIRSSTTSIQSKRIRRFKDKVKFLTRRNSPVNLEKVIEDLNPVLRGFANYFKVANCKTLFEELSQWVRRRLRVKQMKLWKKPSRLHRRLRQLGHKGQFKSIKMGIWRNARSPLAHLALPNVELAKLGLFSLDSVITGVLPQVA
jgi:group II intron reverse transcriptase/maturase